jgi:predicted amidophosphoribosyltransferase
MDVVFPPVCPGCKRVGELFCERCRDDVSWLQDPICIHCGRPLSHSHSHCLSCESRPMPLERVRTAALYQGSVMAAIKQFKYEG